MIYDPGVPSGTTTQRNGRYETERERLAAVQARDPAADGRFVFAVKTTGVFCRPTCRSRLALSKNIEFFDSGGSALAAGYRPCKKCDPRNGTAAHPHAQSVARACARLDGDGPEPSAAELADEIGLSAHQFQRVFRQIVGVTPKQFAIACRAQRFQAALREGRTVTRSIYNAGFNSNSRAYEDVTARIGMSPSALRRGGMGVVIRHAIISSKLGLVLVAATDRGVCAIEFGDSKSALTSRVAELFPRAEMQPADGAVSKMAGAIAAFIDRSDAGLDLPLEVLGTAFQQRVWQELRRVPAGETVTYAQVAQRLGAPRAARAVARACAANRIALAIPCHRVIRGDGELGGFRWGLERKKSLLENESDESRKSPG